MQPTTLDKILTIAESHYGKRRETDMAFLVGQINAGRILTYANEAAREAYFRDTGAVAVQVFVDHYASGSLRCYSGITLPINVTGVTHISQGGRKISVTGERITTRQCRSCGCAAAEIMDQRSVLETEIPAKYLGVIVFKALDGKDAGKRCGVEYVTRSGNIIREDIELSLVGNETSQSPLFFTKITLPTPRCGYIRIMTADGWPLANYHPSVSAPSHLRIKIVGAAPRQIVQYEGFKEPLDVRFLTDLVEFSGEIEWKNLFNFIDLHLNTGKNKSQIQAYSSAAEMARALPDAALKATHPTPVVHFMPALTRRLAKARKFMRGRFMR